MVFGNLKSKAFYVIRKDFYVILKQKKNMAINITEAKKLMIAAASNALSFKEKNPKASDEEAIQYVLKYADQIIKNAQ